MGANTLSGAPPTEGGTGPRDPVRIELQMPLGFKLFAMAVLAGALLMAVVCVANLGMFSYSFATGKTDRLPADGVPLIGNAALVAFNVLGLILFGCGAAVAFRRLRQPSGWLQITPNELTLSCYSLGPTSGILGGFFCAGIAEWSNVSRVAVKRIFGAKCFGIAFNDLTAFLASRERIVDQPVAVTWNERWNGIVLESAALLPVAGKAIGIFMKLIGYSGIPKSAEDIDVLGWNYKNWGYHVVTPVWLIPGEPSRLVELIQRYRSDAISDQSASAGKPLRQASPSAEVRLRELDRLLSGGLISKREHQMKHKQILSEL